MGCGLSKVDKTRQLNAAVQSVRLLEENVAPGGGA